MAYNKRILLLGAGRSTNSLIEYLSRYLSPEKWLLTIADATFSLAEEKAQDIDNCEAVQLDVNDSTKLTERIKLADLVISMLPAHMHPPIAKTCIELDTSFFTASYVSKEILDLQNKAESKNLLILMEMGLDPGIDHMSAKKEIDDIKNQGGKITLFKSFTGGLIAPESDDNPWNYKFTWNPRNVVLAGQGTVKFIRNGRYKYITYHNLFKRLETIEIDGLDNLEGYANRDSLKYRDLYDIQEIPTLLRGTLRKKGFCQAWDIFVQLGMTDDTYTIDCSGLTFRDFINSYLVYSETESVEEKICHFFDITSDNEIMQKLTWLGIFSNEPIGFDEASPAQVLQKLLETKWQLKSEDKDMVVMQHQFEYTLEQRKYKKTSSLVIKGEDADNTSMSKTVGLPLGIATKLYLQNKLDLTGVHIPVLPELYNPILEELKTFDIDFQHKLDFTNR